MWKGLNTCVLIIAGPVFKMSPLSSSSENHSHLLHSTQSYFKTLLYFTIVWQSKKVILNKPSTVDCTVWHFKVIRAIDDWVTGTEYICFIEVLFSALRTMEIPELFTCKNNFYIDSEAFSTVLDCTVSIVTAESIPQCFVLGCKHHTKMNCVNDLWKLWVNYSMNLMTQLWSYVMEIPDRFCECKYSTELFGYYYGWQVGLEES